MMTRKSFTTQLQVRYGDVDPAGIAYFPRIYDLIHQAFEAVWYDFMGKRYDELMMGDGIGFPLVHSEVDFKAPLKFGDEIEVEITCFRLGRSALGLRYRFRVKERVCVDARMTVTCVRLGEFKTVPIPAEYRARFQEIIEA